MREKTKLIGVKAPLGIVVMIDKIIMEKHYSSRSQVLLEAVRMFHQKIFKDYNTYVPKKEKEIKIEKEEICVEGLSGEIITGTGGIKICKFKKYDRYMEYPQEISLDRLSADMVDSQYQPSKEVVESYQIKK